jgi:acetylornithine deacetylase/succinyl-diaminopimelate desuccinylase-like protein
MQEIKNYIEKNKDRFLNELFNFIRIPSVSADESHQGDMLKAAEYLKNHLLQIGADKAEIFETKGHPIVFGEKIINPDFPTVMVYGHYDVQPEGDINLWESPPFEPEIRDRKIFARGADDDKGQLFMHLKAFEFMANHNLLTTNIKFLLEGEEEVGSVNLGDFCREHKPLLTADIILVSDTGMIAQDIPSITVGLRGLAYMEVKVTGPNRDLHSGLFGGAVANPANVLAKLIASLTDENNKITIPGFYDDVVIISDEERAMMAKAPFNIDEYKKALDIQDISGENGYSTIERTGIRPCLDVNGIWSGYTEKGAKTILPSTAHAKISMRLVPNQDPEKIAVLFQKYFEKHAPSTVKIEVEYLHGGDSYMAPTDNKAYLAASRAYSETFDKMPIPTRSGGSIPIIAMFDKVLGIKSILMGFGLESDAIHSPNENYPLFNFYKGIETIPYFYKYFVENIQD